MCFNSRKMGLTQVEDIWRYTIFLYIKLWILKVETRGQALVVHEAFNPGRQISMVVWGQPGLQEFEDRLQSQSNTEKSCLQKKKK